MEALTTLLTTYTFIQTITLIAVSVSVVCVLLIAILLFIKASKLKKIGLSGLEFDTPPKRHRIRKTK